MQLREIAHARAGDKGNIVTIAVIARRPEDYPTLESTLTVERVSAHFASIVARPVVRYAMPSLSALNFVLTRPETEAVTRSLALDAHGKCLSSFLLAIEIQSPAQPEGSGRPPAKS